MKHTQILATLGILWLATLATQLLFLGFRIQSDPESEYTFLEVLLPSAIALSALTLPLAAAGLYLAERIGLGPPLLARIIFLKQNLGAELISGIKLAAACGMLVGTLLLPLLLTLANFLPADTPQIGRYGVMGGLITALSAAVAEEIWMRLGLMTLVLALLLKLSGRAKVTPSLAWIAILLAALAFAGIHLPSLVEGEVVTVVFIISIIGNTLVGSLYGWFYWKKGLEAAIIAHLCVDIPLWVFSALDLESLLAV